MQEQKEAWMRIVVGIISGIILSVWKVLIIVLTIFHFFYVVFTNKRRKDIASFCNLWVSQVYIFIRYMTFGSNSRPFPFSEMGKTIKPVEISNKEK